MLLQRHAEEVRALKEQVRRQKEKNQKAEHRIRDLEAENDSMHRQLKRQKKIIEDKNLGERDQLSQKLTKTESLLSDKEKRVTVRHRFYISTKSIIAVCKE